MFNLFGKKKAQNPRVLCFKSNQAAFEYACKYLESPIQEKRAIVGVVLSSDQKIGFCVKVANPKDSTLTYASAEELLDQKQTYAVSLITAKHESVPDVQAGDLVLFAPNMEVIRQGVFSGMIIAKIGPTLDLETGMFELLDR